MKNESADKLLTPNVLRVVSCWQNQQACIPKVLSYRELSAEEVLKILYRNLGKVVDDHVAERGESLALVGCGKAYDFGSGCAAC